MNETELQRFNDKIRAVGQCLIWIGATTPEGYGQMKADGRVQYAHRLSYEHFVGAIAGADVIDHLCRNRACVRPEHLEAVSNRENIVRGIGPTAVRANAVECIHGHELTGPNLYVKPNGNRVCRQCKNDRQRASRRAAA